MNDAGLLEVERKNTYTATQELCPLCSAEILYTPILPISFSITSLAPG